MGYERTHSFQKKSSHTPQPTTQFSTRPFAPPVQMKPKRQPTPEELENEAFNQHKFEAFGLQLKKKSGTITPVEQERLGVLQAKMDDFWAQRRERASRFSFDFSKIPVHPPEGHPTPQLQPMWRQGTPRVPMKGQRSPLNSPQQLSALPIQAKLTIGEPRDKYEQEADRVASQVVEQINAPASAKSSQGQSVQRREEPEEELQAKPSISNLQRSLLPREVQREAIPPEKDLQAKSLLQRRAGIAGGEASTDLESAINSARGGGQPLDAGLQRSMGQAMGADFSGVRVHTDSKSDQLNQSIQAKAFTTGQDVFFRQGAYDPGSRGGQELIAHELTHVEQQRSSQIIQRGSCISKGLEEVSYEELLNGADVRPHMRGVGVCYDAVAYVLFKNGVIEEANLSPGGNALKAVFNFEGGALWSGGAIERGRAIGFLRLLDGEVFHAAISVGGTRIRGTNSLGLGSGWTDEVDLAAALQPIGDGIYEYDNTRIQVYISRLTKSPD